jgi:hypothetical protein
MIYGTRDYSTVLTGEGGGWGATVFRLTEDLLPVYQVDIRRIRLPSPPRRRR